MVLETSVVYTDLITPSSAIMESAAVDQLSYLRLTLLQLPGALHVLVKLPPGTHCSHLP